MKNLCLAGGVALNCVGQRQAPARGPVRGHLDPAGGRRRRRRAGRGAVRLAPVSWTSRATADGTRRACSGSLPRAALSPTTRSRASSTRPARRTPSCRRRRAARARRRAARRRRRSSAGSRAAWSSARARWAAARILGDAALAEDAVGDEPEDQVPRVVPAVRARGAARSASPSTSSWTGDEPVHAAGGAGARSSGASPMTDEQQTAVRHRQAQRAALRHPGDHPRGLLGAHPDRAPRDQPALPRAARGASSERTGCPVIINTCSTCAASRSSARRRTPTAASCAPTWTIWCWRTSCSPRPSSRIGNRTSLGKPSSNWIRRRVKIT